MLPSSYCSWLGLEMGLLSKHLQNLEHDILRGIVLHCRLYERQIPHLICYNALVEATNALLITYSSYNILIQHSPLTYSPNVSGGIIDSFLVSLLLLLELHAQQPFLAILQRGWRGQVEEARLKRQPG